MATTETKNTQLKQKFQQHIDEAKQRLESAKQDIASLHEEDKEAIRKKSDELKKRMGEQQAKAQQLKKQVTTWLQDKKQQTDDQITSWRQKREVKHLERRADRAEEYALNTIFAAMMDADEAEMAVLDALDARLDAEEAVTQ
jgi:hypothetical protein